MEKICEFCKAIRPVVYCKADAALLCLSCDAKVHSANALSSRHLRTLLCDCCRQNPAYLWCLNHRMFMCHGCDRDLHGVSSQHQKRAINSYMGCPSAKDFVVMWGFDLSELENNGIPDRSVSSACVAANTGADKSGISGQSSQQIGGFSIASKSSCATSVSSTESEMGSSSQKCQILYDQTQQQNISSLLVQILYLKRLNLTEGNNSFPLINRKGQIETSTVSYPTEKLDETLDQDLQCSQASATDLQRKDNLLQEQKDDSLLMPFTQLENRPSPSTVGIPFQGDSFWQCKSPVQSNELWTQNMQDIGVCEDNVCNDDFDIPDVDLTFQNFEELFGGDQDPVRAQLDDMYVLCSLEKDLPLDKPVQANAIVQDNSSESYNIYLGNMDSPLTNRPSYSSLSISTSRYSAESSGIDSFDSRASPVAGDVSGHLPDQDCAHSEARENAMMRYKEKKKARRLENQIQYPSRKPRAEQILQRG